MERREFLKILLAGSLGSLINRPLTNPLSSIFIDSRYLPPPQINNFSSEIVLNSRRSYHSGYTSSLSDQILANILWAASRAPLIGTNRIIYVARTDNVYRYDPNSHDIVLHLSGNHKSESNAAFEVGIASDIAEDAGTSIQFAQLASISFWNTNSNQPASCPKESATTNANNTWSPSLTVQMVNVYGLMSSVSGITSECVAHSSNGSLPDPNTNGTIILENALANLKYGNLFSDTELNLNQLSQLAWASYGNTPHTTSNGRAGITVPSAVANYYLTGKIYIVRSVGVERYHIRLPSGSASSRDHRIERVTDGDRRPQLRSAIPRLPQTAPNYFVYCATTASRYQLLEAGFAGASALLQATCINLQGYFTANFSSSERTAIINALGIPTTDLPLFIFSAGQEYVGIKEQESKNQGILSLNPNPFRDKVRIHYQLNNSSRVNIAIYDTSGNLVKNLHNDFQPAGKYTIFWDGKNQSGKKIPSGVYFIILNAGEKIHKEKLTKI
ncbi:MAG: FlgD immunoglobulin-like domain containing protein [candidate division WOR-3 bacterium]